MSMLKEKGYSSFKDLDQSVKERFSEALANMKKSGVNDADFVVLEPSEAEKDLSFVNSSSLYQGVFYDAIRSCAVGPCNFSTFLNLKDRFYSIDLSKIDEKSPDKWLLTDSRFVFIYVYGVFDAETLEFKSCKKRIRVPVFNLLNPQSQLFALKAVKIEERTKKEVEDALEKEKESLNCL